MEYLFRNVNELNPESGWYDSQPPAVILQEPPITYCLDWQRITQTQINEDFEGFPEERRAYAAVFLWKAIEADYKHQRWGITLHAFSWTVKTIAPAALVV